LSSARFKSLLEPVWHLLGHQVVLDGEVIILTPEGEFGFSRAPGAHAEGTYDDSQEEHLVGTI
jgi:hypothetical protein